MECSFWSHKSPKTQKKEWKRRERSLKERERTELLNGKEHGANTANPGMQQSI